MKYINPEMEIIEFVLLDVLTSSPGGLDTDSDIPKDPNELPTIPGGEY